MARSWAARLPGVGNRCRIVAAAPIALCGACRQVMTELAPDAVALPAAADGEFMERTVDELLPGAFRLPG